MAQQIVSPGMDARFDWLDELKLHRWEFLAHEPDVWVACETRMSKVLEDAWQADQVQHAITVTIGNYKYQVCMDDLTQTNLLTGRARRLRRSHATDPAKLQQAMDFCAAYTAMEKELCQERRAHEKLQRLVDRLQAAPSALHFQECQEKQILKLQMENREKFFQTQLNAERREKEALQLQVREMQEQEEKASVRSNELKRSLEHKDVCLQQQERVLFNLTLTRLPDCSTLPGSVNLTCYPAKEHAFRAVSHIFLESMVSHRKQLGSNLWCPPPKVIITGVEEVVNPAQQHLYEAARNGEVMQRNPQGCEAIPNITAFKCASVHASVDLNEHLFFHGCPLDACKRIARQGLHPQRGGEAVGSLFGKGAYFAQNASKCDMYTTCSECSAHAKRTDCRHAQGERCVLVVRVLLGNSHKQSTPYSGHRAPERADGELYDSLTALSREQGGAVDHMEFIIFEKSLAFVRYLVRYRHCRTCECHICQHRRR